MPQPPEQGNRGRPPRRHRCAVAGCAADVPATMAMCLSHWQAVPRDLQRALLRAYRDRRRPGGVAAHLQALEDARAPVEGREPRELFGDVDAGGL